MTPRLRSTVLRLDPVMCIVKICCVLLLWCYWSVQVQPDLDELPVNMEDNEDAESTKSEVKLGKLQFSLDYDFQKGEVGQEIK